MNLRPLANLVPLALCASLLVGCGDDADPQAGPSRASSASESSSDATTDTPTDTPTDSGTTDPDPEPVDPQSSTLDPDEETDTPSTPSTPVPADAEDLCAAFAGAYDALLETGPEFSGDQDEKVPADLVEAFQQWGQDLADADLPSDFTADQRAGVGIMSRVLLAVPDDATGKDLDAIDKDLSAQENQRVESVTDYVDKTCDLDF